MQREVRRLERQASMVVDDLVRTLGGSWTITVDEGWWLRVDGAGWAADRAPWAGVAELDHEVDEDDEAAEADDVEVGMDADAANAVADQVGELVGNARLPFPLCPQHGCALDVAGGRWVCDDDESTDDAYESHDVAAIGRLGAG